LRKESRLDSPTTPGQIVGRNLRAVRARKLFSQRDLAERSGIAKITIATLELGKSAHPRRRTVEKLARALDVPVEDLLSEEPPSPKAESRSSLEPTFNDLLAEERLPRSREESAFIVVGRVVDKGLPTERYTMVVLWNVPEEERAHYRPVVERMLGAGYLEEELPEGMREVLAGVSG
jgi:transcriptional regulator with XRE-family HTH domain